MSDAEERRRAYRYRATLKLSFKYAGRRHQAITTEISPRGAAIVAPVRLPVGAILLFDVEDSTDTPDLSGVRLIAQVNWASPAPFGGSDAWAAGLELLRATGGSWNELITFLKKRLRAESGSIVREDGSTQQPSVDLTEVAQHRGSGFEALFNNEGVWFRGEIVTANMDTVWVRTARMAPSIGAPVRVRIAVRDDGKLVAVDVSGRVPGNPIADQQSRGWIFEVEIGQINHTDLYDRLLKRLDAEAPQ